MWSNERFSSMRTTTWVIAARPVPPPADVVIGAPFPGQAAGSGRAAAPSGRRSRAGPTTTLSGLVAARGGFVRRGPRRLGDLLVRVVFAQVVEYLHGARVRAAGHALEQQLLAAGRNRLAEADREVLRVGELLVDGEGQQVGGDPGEVIRRHLKLRGEIDGAAGLRVDAGELRERDFRVGPDLRHRQAVPPGGLGGSADPGDGG